MKKQSESIDGTDILFFPVAFASTYILRRWISPALAAALSGVVVLLIIALFASRERSLKRFILPILLTGLIIYALGAVFNWPP